MPQLECSGMAGRGLITEAETCVDFTSSRNSWTVEALHYMHFPVPPAKLHASERFRLIELIPSKRMLEKIKWFQAQDHISSS